jgi:hypothetical protein
MAFQKNILKYLYSEKITHNIINKGCHINFYGQNMSSLLHYNISLFRFFSKLLEGEGQKTTSHRTYGNRDRTGEFQVKPSIGRSSFCHDGPQQKVHTFACSECHCTPLEVEIPRRKKSTTQHFYLFIYGIWVRFLIFKSGKPGAHLRVHLCVLI